MKSLSDYLTALQTQGKPSFTTDEVVEALGISRKAFSMSAARLRKKKALVSLYRDFHIIVPPEYRGVGSPPADEILPPFMAYLQIPYYVCLLSAAEYHGASHQKPMVFQVMTSKRLTNIKRDGLHIEFSYKRDVSEVPLQKVVVRTGFLVLSTPEATAMDLLRYPHRSGGISHIATVLTELIENVIPKKLSALAEASSETAWIQRLGYLLECIDPLEEAYFRQQETIRLLKKIVEQRKPAYVPLVQSKSEHYTKNKVWKVIVNTDVESDI